MLERLSLVDVQWKAPAHVSARSAPQGGKEFADGKGSSGESLHCQYELEVELKRVGFRGGRSAGAGAPRVYAPRFPKVRSMTEVKSNKSPHLRYTISMCIQGIVVVKKGYKLLLPVYGYEKGGVWTHIARVTVLGVEHDSMLKSPFMLVS